MLSQYAVIGNSVVVFLKQFILVAFVFFTGGRGKNVLVTFTDVVAMRSSEA